MGKSDIIDLMQHCGQSYHYSMSVLKCKFIGLLANPLNLSNLQPIFDC